MHREMQAELDKLNYMLKMQCQINEQQTNEVATVIIVIITIITTIITFLLISYNFRLFY